MKKVIIQNEVDGRSFGATFESDEQMQAWIDSQVAIDSWGKKEREVNSDEGMPERVLSTRQVEQLIGEELVLETLYTLKADYVISIEDVTSAHNLQQLRLKRDGLLVQTDKYLLSDYPVSAEELINIKAYRIYLRDITQESPLPVVPLTYEEWLNS